MLSAPKIKTEATHVDTEIEPLVYGFFWKFIRL